MHALTRWVVATLFVLTLARPVWAQEPVGPNEPLPPATVPATAVQPPLAPATKLEAFVPAAGSVVTIGYDRLGNAGAGVSVEVREMRDATGAMARGLVVNVTESQGGQVLRESAFVDADEMPELLKGIDALLDIKTNPTPLFRLYEVRYRTRGDLLLMAFNTGRGGTGYAVRAGRLLTAQRVLDQVELAKLRELFQAAAQKLWVVSQGR